MSKIIVGMSGGVDSSVAAHLLKEEGHEVIGVFMKNWDPALNGDLADPYIDKEICQAEEDFEDAKKVADSLGIELHKVDFVDEYWNKVFNYFLNQYKKGYTPNPDIFCNKYIKFKAFMEYAFENFECDYIAMGHYAKVVHEPEVKLLRAKDTNKDQTYFLEQLSVEQLSKSLFPLGDLNKSEVREIASKLNLVTASKKDSTGICFIGERNFSKFLSSYIEDKEGKLIDIDSNLQVGTHTGVSNYTIGQRKGLGIGGDNRFENKPWFVCSKDVENNIVYVCQEEDNIKLMSNNCVVENINYTGNKDSVIKSVKFRYRSSDVNVTKYEWIDDNKIYLEYDLTSSVTPGQAAVFYEDIQCLGGGEIRDVKYNNEVRAYENSSS